eukprot:CAMPEP_0169147108 /NCGR_PEP_ID=MMETSP1015-20121227/48011_1 /TAXON_ID=342587 /ORGANISM="Karlodinium micrum, Strain CCMP2283" /LENGTH=44 /DNA_ID= /DNA_START= /DNA_END= /DNA_ORIENTATION=
MKLKLFNAASLHVGAEISDVGASGRPRGSAVWWLGAMCAILQPI